MISLLLESQSRRNMQSVAIVLLVVVVVAFVQASKDKLMKKHMVIVEECGKIHSMTNETMMYTIEHKMAIPDETSEDQRCFIQCIMEKHEEIKDGKYYSEGTMKVFSEIQTSMKQEGKELDMTKVRAVVQECSTKDGNGKCMKNYLINKCIFSKFEDNIDSFLVS